jgi:hypothetical protein
MTISLNEKAQGKLNLPSKFKMFVCSKQKLLKNKKILVFEFKNNLYLQNVHNKNMV